MNDEFTYQSIADIAKYFNIKSNELNQIFIKLQWAEQNAKWWTATEAGIRNGAKQEYNARTKQKYIMWSSEVKNNNQLIHEVKTIKNTKHAKTDERKEDKTNNKPQKMTDKEKKEKGDLYEEFISNHFRTQGYTIAEHGKDNGVKDHGIDIIAKKGREVLFIQCKNWSANSSRKVKSDDMKIARQNIQDYKTKNPIYEMYDMKILYVISENVLHGSAYHYVQENSEIMEFRIIPIIK